MTSFQHLTDVPYVLLARYPGIHVSSLTGGRSALQINLDARRARRAEAKGR